MKLLFALVAVGLLVYAAIDCSRTPAGELPSSLSRPGWLVLVILLPLIGPILYILASRMNERPPAPPAPSAPSVLRRPIGPDDDPDFLRRL